MYMTKSISVQIRDSLAILVALMILVTLLLVVIGKIHVNSPVGEEFGLYASAFKGLPSYRNPLVDLIGFVCLISLLVLPIVLFVFRKKLRLYVMPWLIAALLVVVSLIVFPYYGSSGMIDFSVSSKASYLIARAIFVIFSIAISYACLFTYLKLHEDKP